jgi:hypothetical protein
MFSNLFEDKVAVYEIMWKNVVEPGRPQTTIWRMRIACWLHKAINTHSEYIILIAFPLQQWLHESSSTLSYTYSARIVIKTINHLHLPRIEALSRDHSEVTTDRDVPALGEENTVNSNVLPGLMSRSSEYSSLSARSQHTTKQQPSLLCPQHGHCYFIGLSS